MDNQDVIIFNQLFSEYKGKFIRFSQYYLRDNVVAEDIVMDALMYYWENRSQLPEDTNIPAYVLTIVKHKCLNYLKRQQLHQQVTDNILSHEQWKLSTNIATLEACEPYELFSSEIQEIVDRTIERMSPRTRQIFTLSRIRNMPHKEIAESLGMTVKGVEFHVAKALKLLRIELKDYLYILIFFL